ncbi:NADP-dependent phosphogluconate dehydrogenase [Candidatus Poribacteria bacterium]|nr:NADP-dependent phosphogluconate dehydrogenase [Candidatus Poribacteria bacterium]
MNDRPGSYDIGLIGLAVMGANLARNIERNGFSVAVFNRTTARTEEFIANFGAGRRFLGTKGLQEFVSALSRPRRVILMVQAGAPVDAFMEQLVPLLDPGDILVDAGNSLFHDTVRRQAAMRDTGIRYVGMGVSGGEEGALNGPSIMPGGERGAYESLEPILKRIAAQTEDGPCVSYIGEGGAGHFVKMVHNGIEYGDMQLITEAYDLLRNGFGIPAERLAEVFDEWNRGELKSYLIEITADILNHRDPDGGTLTLDTILDSAGQKGTGRWTVMTALDLSVPIPTITAAVDARFVSALKQERVRAASLLGSHTSEKPTDSGSVIADVRAALYASKVCSYAQGMALLRAADASYGFGLQFEEIARIWKGGCIIRAVFLDEIKAAYQRDGSLPNLLLDPHFRAGVEARLDAWRRVVASAVRLGIAAPAMAASLAYFDAYRRADSAASLIQAQRDYFGAHTYQRTDREGTFHTQWSSG